MSVRARFAPSPTGQVHIGNIRTAIFNWLFARHSGGSFILRIEDTDLERSTKAAIDTLLECMNWLGLNYDEEPMYQTKQCPKHLAAAKKLEEAGNAYKADPTAEHSPLYFRIPYNCSDFPFVRTTGKAEITLAPENSFVVNRAGLTYFTVNAKGKAVESQACLAGFCDLKVYDSANSEIFSLNSENIQNILNGSETFETTLAAKITYTKREVFYQDLVKGEMAKPLDSMRDFIIIRSDGSPVFHLANVWDDIDQRITHIIRGDDHVENTFRHLFLFHLLGSPIPVYAHLPMIVNQQGKPYSKRDGDAFVGDFREKGILPEALFNYLTLIGWAPGDNREKMSKAELSEAFRIERAQRSCAQFATAKLISMNALYIAELSDADFSNMAWDFAARYSWREHADRSFFDKVAALMKIRTKVFTDIEGWHYFFNAVETYDAKGVSKFLSTPEQRKGLSDFAAELSAQENVDEAWVENKLRSLESAAGMKEFSLNQPLRVAVTGTTVGAGMYETVILLGKEETVKRIESALVKNPVS